MACLLIIDYKSSSFLQIFQTLSPCLIILAAVYARPVPLNQIPCRAGEYLEGQLHDRKTRSWYPGPDAHCKPCGKETYTGEDNQYIQCAHCRVVSLNLVGIHVIYSRY